jgi:hypothetical protein
MKFAEKPPQRIEHLISDKEEKDHIFKALQMHMIENRKDHLLREEEENPQIKQASDFGKAFGEEHQAKQETPKIQRDDQNWREDPKSHLSPVRKMCECCMRFLTHSFGMTEDQAQKFIGDVSQENPQFYNSVNSTYSSDSSSDGYSGESRSSNYNDPSGYANQKPTY